MMRVCREHRALVEKERPRKTKIDIEVAHVTRDSDTTFEVKRSKVNLQGAGPIMAASRTACWCCIRTVSVFALIKLSKTNKTLYDKYYEVTVFLSLDINLKYKKIKSWAAFYPTPQGALSPADIMSGGIMFVSRCSPLKPMKHVCVFRSAVYSQTAKGASLVNNWIDRSISQLKLIYTAHTYVASESLPLSVQGAAK